MWSLIVYLLIILLLVILLIVVRLLVVSTLKWSLVWLEAFGSDWMFNVTCVRSIVFILSFVVILVNVFLLEFRVFIFIISLVERIIFWIGLYIVYRLSFNMHIIKFRCWDFTIVWENLYKFWFYRVIFKFSYCGFY